MKPSKEIRELRHHDLENGVHIQLADEVAKLEVENEKIAKAAESGIAKAWKRVEILESEIEQCKAIIEGRHPESGWAKVIELERQIIALKADCEI